MTRQTAVLLFSTALAAALAGPLAAQSKGDWTVGVGFGYVVPKSDNGTLAGGAATIGESARPTFTGEYFFRDNWGIELLAAAPFKHDVNIGGAYAATVKQLPPTLSVNYHFPTQTAFAPFVGLGLNYTTFFDETSPLGVVRVEDSLGLAAHAGLDYAISDRGSLRMDVRWVNINSDVTLNGAYIGEAEIDPLVWGISYVHRF
ncbi:OmpW/AlkL family protein [Antarcticimicrobium luteum]|uniref:OmpW family protein n=1 Tax=Antarcticimicrobium luteum TaxID=2547397 RepID=A0A4R5UV01_9RHOB|nr:OmpW family outer membrane protein [Antarcticimicrobium luteum]TDK43058.1 OmpW family protein [Antarcticimicrobium luteum]